MHWACLSVKGIQHIVGIVLLKVGQNGLQCVVPLILWLVSWKLKIYVDGGMKPATIHLAKAADYIISGSYLAKSENFKKAMKELKTYSKK